MISQTGEYALRAAVFLAQHEIEPQTSAAIAEGTLVPHGYLSKVLQSLVRRGLVTSRRGLGGGFLLARDPRKISVLDVLQAADTPLQRITKCPLGLKGHVSLCPVHRLVDDAIARSEKAFRSATLHSLSGSTTGIKPLCSVPETTSRK